MSTQAKTGTINASLQDLMNKLGRTARDAAQVLAIASTDQKNAALIAMAAALRQNRDTIKQANAQDMAAGQQNGLSKAMLDRLMLDDSRIDTMAKGIEDIAGLADPVGATMARWTRPNGLDISRVRTPLGVIGVIYESRPNVTADAGALCLKAGNGVILRGGSEAVHSNHAIHACLQQGLEETGLPAGAISLVPTQDRDAVGILLRLTEYVDVIVPRGGKSLVARVQQDARVPVFAHLEGICHVYVHEKADLEMARAIVVNAKMRRTGICGAAETLLIDKAIAADYLPAIAADLQAAGCTLRGDEAARNIVPEMDAATEEDWSTEYLDSILSVKVVDNIDAAMAHITTYGSSHTETIVTNDTAAAEKFCAGLDSAILLHNASTQFADGGEFGMGAEIGIATGKLHARGPVGVEQLTSFKYVVRGTGQIRP